MIMNMVIMNNDDDADDKNDRFDNALAMTYNWHLMIVFAKTLKLPQRLDNRNLLASAAINADHRGDDDDDDLGTIWNIWRIMVIDWCCP